MQRQTAGAHTSHLRNQQGPGMEGSGRGAWRREAQGQYGHSRVPCAWENNKDFIQKVIGSHQTTD